MFKLLSVSVLSLSLLFSATTFAAAEVKVTWQNPDDYTDVRPTNESRTHFKERTFKELESYFAKLAEQLPDDSTLNITVTNLDLAGQVWPSSFVLGTASASDVRLVKRVDIPRIKFSYTLTNADGKVMKSAEVNLKDMGFLDSPRLATRNDFLGYEKQMLKEWFREEMTGTLAKK